MRRVVDYKDGKIYEIVNLLTLVTYIGSTATTLDRRESEHQNFSKWCQKPLYAAMRQDGIKNFAMRLIKPYPCNSRRELEQEEHRVAAARVAGGQQLYNVEVRENGKRPAHVRAAISRAKLGVATKCGYCKCAAGKWTFVYRAGGKNVSKSFAVRKFGYWASKKMAYALRKTVYPNWAPPAEEEIIDAFLQIEI